VCVEKVTIFPTIFKTQCFEDLHGAEVGIGTNARASWEGICGPQFVFTQKHIIVQLFKEFPHALLNLNVHQNELLSKCVTV
jgi:hypothetical protein